MQSLHDILTKQQNTPGSNSDDAERGASCAAATEETLNAAINPRYWVLHNLSVAKNVHMKNLSHANHFDEILLF